MGTEAQTVPCEPEVEMTRAAAEQVAGSKPASGAKPAKASGSKTEGRNQAQVTNHRILIVDDNPAIHADFRKVLCGGNEQPAELVAAETALFGAAPATPAPGCQFELQFAHQGEEALKMVRQALAEGRPYAMAFIDVRMPPGWDGIETISRIWQEYPDLQVVVCTACSDYSWEQMTAKLGTTNNLVLLKKPFDNVEVLQLAHAFTCKWELNRQAQLKLSELNEMVSQRTRELEAANRELTREVHERLQLERQFRQAQKMEAIGQLAAGVAHDFNNILTVIHGHASMLLMRLGEDSPHAKSALQVRLCAERATNLVRQLLTFSRKQIMQFRSVELGEVIRNVSSMLHDVVGEHITLETECASELPPIYADRGMMEQVIVNLTVNARDAMPRGGRITIQASALTATAERAAANPEARPGQFVCLRLSDTGCGMDAELLSHLFEPFFTTKEVGKGTGLGLATVYGIVKQHQGWIEVQSQPGHGTTFQIYFPVSDQTTQHLPEATEETPQRTGTETILIAEDENPLREMVAEILSDHGYRVLAASSGPAALELWQREKSSIDLLLTDMVMPGGMMGTDLVEELKRVNPRLKVIYTTGYSPGMVCGADGLREGTNFLPKPYSPRKLAEIVRKCLDKHAA